MLYGMSPAPKAFLEELLHIYQTNEVPGPSKTLEADLHGFFYGSLALNFKYLYNLDINVERTAGKGFLDMMVLFRNGENGDTIPMYR